MLKNDLLADVKRHPQQLPSQSQTGGMLSAGWVGALLFLPSTCSGLIRPSVRSVWWAPTEQELRLVTNLTKLRPSKWRDTAGSCPFPLEANMRRPPTGSGEGHRGRRAAPLETAAEPTTPWAPWGGGTKSTIIQDPLKCDRCYSFPVLWPHILPLAACRRLTENVGRDRRTHSRLPAIQIPVLRHWPHTGTRVSAKLYFPFS